MMAHTLPSDKELIILQLLVSESEMYGLQMVKEGPPSGLRHSSIYVLLTRMVARGYLSARLESEEEQTNPGPKRRLYKITAFGEAMRQARLAADAAAAPHIANAGPLKPEGAMRVLSYIRSWTFPTFRYPTASLAALLFLTTAAMDVRAAPNSVETTGWEYAGGTQSYDYGYATLQDGHNVVAVRTTSSARGKFHEDFRPNAPRTPQWYDIATAEPTGGIAGYITDTISAGLRAQRTNDFYSVGGPDDHVIVGTIKEPNADFAYIADDPPRTGFVPKDRYEIDVDPVYYGYGTDPRTYTLWVNLLRVCVLFLLLALIRWYRDFQSHIRKAWFGTRETYSGHHKEISDLAAAGVTGWPLRKAHIGLVIATPLTFVRLISNVQELLNSLRSIAGR